MEFIERDPSERQIIHDWKRALTRTEQHVVSYSPTFRWFGPTQGSEHAGYRAQNEEPSNQSSGDPGSPKGRAEIPGEHNPKDVKLDGLEHFALQVPDKPHVSEGASRQSKP